MVKNVGRPAPVLVIKRPSSCRYESTIPRRDFARAVHGLPSIEGGRRESRVLAAPAASHATKKAHERSHHRFAETVRPSLRNGLRLIPRSPRRPGFLATVARELLHRLDASVGASGPHGFAVRYQHRSSREAKASIASRPTFVTMANAPLDRGGTRRGWR